MKLILCTLSLFLMMAANLPAKDPAHALDFKMKDIHGKEIALSDFKGDVLLMVNVASECGYTPQYKGLQAIHEKYKDQGFKVIGFPCNQFGRQEPGSNEEILAFCTDRYSVSFPMMSKIDVKGDNQAPLYTYLTSDKEHGGEIRWNFEKFLVGRDGKIVAHYRSSVKPEGPELTGAIEAELKK